MSLTWSPAVPCSGESSVGCGQGVPLGSQVLAFTGSSQTLWTPFHAGWAEAASLSGVSVSLCFCHTVPELKLGRARASASSVLALCVCVAAEGRFPAPSSAPTATSPSCFPVSFCLLQKVGLPMVAEKLGCGEGALGAVPEPWGWRPVCSASRLLLEQVTDGAEGFWAGGSCLRWMSLSFPSLGLLATHGDSLSLATPAGTRRSQTQASRWHCGQAWLCVTFQISACGGVGSRSS